MAAGPGYLDAQGVYQFGEADVEALASDLLNLGQQSISTQFEDVRTAAGTLSDRVTDLEEAVVKTASFTTSVSLANATNGTLGTLTPVTAQTNDSTFVGTPSAGTIRLQPGVYVIDIDVLLPVVITGLTMIGTVFAGVVRRSAFGVGTQQHHFSQAPVVITAADTDVQLFLYQTTGATRTVTGNVVISKLGDFS